VYRSIDIDTAAHYSFPVQLLNFTDAVCPVKASFTVVLDVSEASEEDEVGKAMTVLTLADDRGPTVSVEARRLHSLFAQFGDVRFFDVRRSEDKPEVKYSSITAMTCDVTGCYSLPFLTIAIYLNSCMPSRLSSSTSTTPVTPSRLPPPSTTGPPLASSYASSTCLTSRLPSRPTMNQRSSPPLPQTLCLTPTPRTSVVSRRRLPSTRKYHFLLMRHPIRQRLPLSRAQLLTLRLRHPCTHLHTRITCLHLSIHSSHKFPLMVPLRLHIYKVICMALSLPFILIMFIPAAVKV
jgi:hypothetical protein